MEDKQIIMLFENRDETAICELSNKYNKFCFKIAWNILGNYEDVEECVNDTWFLVWRYIPPKKPSVLSAFCGKIVKGLAIDRLRKRCAQKRVDNRMTDIISETGYLNKAINLLEEEMQEKLAVEEINEFLDTLETAKRDMFIRRYWYLDTIDEIAERHGKSKGSVKNTLYRVRRQLHRHLEERGVL